MEPDDYPHSGSVDPTTEGTGDPTGGRPADDGEGDGPAAPQPWQEPIERAMALVTAQSEQIAALAQQIEQAKQQRAEPAPSPRSTDPLDRFLGDDPAASDRRRALQDHMVWRDAVNSSDPKVAATARARLQEAEARLGHLDREAGLRSEVETLKQELSELKQAPQRAAKVATQREALRRELTAEALAKTPYKAVAEAARSQQLDVSKFAEALADHVGDALVGDDAGERLAGALRFAEAVLAARPPSPAEPERQPGLAAGRFFAVPSGRNSVPDQPPNDYLPADQHGPRF